MEKWKDVKGYEGHYIISNLGRVKSLTRKILKRNGTVETKKGRSIKIQHNKRVNVYEVHLKRNNKRKCFKIHRLVAEHFIENDCPESKTTVNHIDGDRGNNVFSNLEWASQSQNLKHAYDVLKRPVNISRGKRMCKSISVDGIEEVYDSIAHASRCTNISETQIRRLINKECINKKYKFYYI